MPSVAVLDHFSPEAMRLEWSQMEKAIQLSWASRDNVHGELSELSEEEAALESSLQRALRHRTKESKGAEDVVHVLPPVNVTSSTGKDHSLFIALIKISHCSSSTFWYKPSFVGHHKQILYHRRKLWRDDLCRWWRDVLEAEVELRRRHRQRLFGLDHVDWPSGPIEDEGALSPVALYAAYYSRPELAPARPKPRLPIMSEAARMARANIVLRVLFELSKLTLQLLTLAVFCVALLPALLLFFGRCYTKRKRLESEHSETLFPHTDHPISRFILDVNLDQSQRASSSITPALTHDNYADPRKEVRIRAIVQHLVEVNTNRHTFKAAVTLEATWLDRTPELQRRQPTFERQEPLYEVLEKGLNEGTLNDCVWTPQFVFLNLLNSEKSENWFKVYPDHSNEESGTVVISQRWHVRGEFSEEFELENFP